MRTSCESEGGSRLKARLEDKNVEYERFNSLSYVCLVYAAGQGKLHEIETIKNRAPQLLTSHTGVLQ